MVENIKISNQPCYMSFYSQNVQKLELNCGFKDSWSFAEGVRAREQRIDAIEQLGKESKNTRVMVNMERWWENNWEVFTESINYWKK